MSPVDELDLETGAGNPDVSAMAERRRRRRERTAETSGSEKAKAKPAASDGKVSTEIRSRLERVFDRAVKWRVSRGDEELAEALTEDGPMMTDAVISVTDMFNPLRVPVLVFLAVCEPLLAFGRVARILLTRWMTRRQGEQEEPPTEGYQVTPAGVYER